MILKHTYNGEEVTIEWERGDFQDSSDHVVDYCATGESDDGRQWSARWCECCDEVEIEDIVLEANY
jgi:hypothetical protein